MDGELHPTLGTIFHEASVAYGAQESWVLNETVRSNIVFDEEEDHKEVY
jgi:hypothetical protein